MSKNLINFPLGKKLMKETRKGNNENTHKRMVSSNGIRMDWEDFQHK